MECSMKKITLLTASAALVLAFGTGSAFADGDAEAGKKVFNKCKSCHTFDASKKKIGPHLNGVIDRAAGAVEGFKYSKAMMESGLTWDEETLDKFLEKPKDLVKGTKMSMAGLKKEDDRENVIAYIKSQSD
jgi:cytochrome c